MAATRSLGVALLMVGGGIANAQFAVDRGNPPAPRPMPTAAAASGFQPASAGMAPGTQAVMPAGGIPRGPQAIPQPMPARAELDQMVKSELENHPLALKPEHGPYVICVRSYSRPAWVQNGPSALSLADALANEIRTTQRTPAFLFEHISDEKKAEFARRESARLEQQPFLLALKAQRERSKQIGTEFLEPERGVDTIRYKTVRYNDQFAVIIAGFRTDADARKALEIVRKWPAPKNLGLLDLGTVKDDTVDPKTGKSVNHNEQGYINPYGQAFVSPNPTLPRAAAATSGVDDFTIKLNEGRPYNLLKVKKPWTLAVKQFSAPASMQGANTEKKTLSRWALPVSLFSSEGADALNAGAEMAEETAKMLRGMRDRSGQDRSEEAFVLHTRTGSLVTVGQYDGPDDPTLLQARRRLTDMNVKFTMSDKENTPGRPLNPQEKLFSDNIVPIPVPR